VTMERPPDDEFDPFYAGYVACVSETDVLGVLAAQTDVLRAVAGTVPPDQELRRYAPDKWSLREVFGHLTDAEWVFGYRALCISRQDATPLPGFDEQAYVARSSFLDRSLADHVHLFGTLRAANLLLLRQLDAPRWRQTGNANGSRVSVRALAYIMAGHVRHHLTILDQRYGVSTG